MKSGVYQITFRNKVYIGSSRDYESRWREHMKHLRANRHASKTLQRAFNRHTDGPIYFDVLEHVPVIDLIAVEQVFLDLLKPFGRNGYNTLITAGSPLGIKRSAEWCAAKSAAMKGRRLLSDEAYARAAEKRRGLKQTDEAKNRKLESFRKTIEARRATGWTSALRGRRKTPEHVEKMRAANLGKKYGPRSIATCVKQSLALRGKKRTPEQCARNSEAQKLFHLRSRKDG